MLKVLNCSVQIFKSKIERGVRNAMSENMTSPEEDGLNIRTNASPKWERARYPEE